MKQNKIKIYAKAIAEIIAEGKDSKKIADNFAKVLVKAGLQNKAKEILNLAEDMLLAKQGNKKIVFETARKMTAGQKKLLESIAKKGDKVQEKINPELIAGVKIIFNNEKQFDNSMQNKLQNIFK